MPANIGAELQALPLEYMLASPMTAAIKAQALAASTTVDFIERVGLETDTAGATTLRTASFDFKQQVADPASPGSTVERDATLSVPVLSIIPIPYIRVADLNVSFEFKVRDVSSEESKKSITGTAGFSSTTTSNASFGVSAKVSGLYGAHADGSVEQKTNVTASVSATYQATNRASTDRSATFKMTLNAVQDELPEGLARVLSILNDTIAAQAK